MKKFNYQYDYQFLSNWLNENKNIRRKNVMEVLEMSDYKTFQNWTEGKTIMPPSQMMRFCNYYSVPIECFFVNKVDVKQSQIDGTIESNDKWEHFDGRTGTHVYDPTCTMHFESYLSDNNESIIPKYLISLIDLISVIFVVFEACASAYSCNLSIAGFIDFSFTVLEVSFTFLVSFTASFLEGLEVPSLIKDFLSFLYSAFSLTNAARASFKDIFLSTLTDSFCCPC